MIRLQCPNDACGRLMNVPGELAGTTQLCPACQRPFNVPGPSEARTRMLISVQCPSAGCGRMLTAPPELAGTVQPCPACGQAVGIPSESEPRRPTLQGLSAPPIGASPAAGTTPQVAASTGADGHTDAKLRPGQQGNGNAAAPEVDEELPSGRDFPRVAQRRRAPTARLQTWDTASWEGEKPEFLSLAPGGPIGFLGAIGGWFASRRMTQKRFVRGLRFEILVGEVAGVIGAAVVLLGDLIFAAKWTDFGPLVQGLIFAVVFCSATYVGSHFARAGVNWIFDAPLWMSEAATIQAIGMVFAPAGFGLVAMGVWRFAGRFLAEAATAPVLSDFVGDTLFVVGGIVCWYEAWLVFNSHVLGVRVGPKTAGHGSRLLAQVSGLWLFFLRQLVIGGAGAFAALTIVGTLLLFGAMVLLLADNLLGAVVWWRSGLTCYVAGILFPVVAYFVYLAGSIIPELFSLVSRIEANTHGGAAIRAEPEVAREEASRGSSDPLSAKD